MKKVLIFMAVTIFSTVANADLSPEVFLNLSKGGKIERQSIEMYVGGVAKGYLNANGYLSANRQQVLFCYKGDISTAEALQITKKAVDERLKNTPQDFKQEVVELLLLMKLKQMHPC